MSPEGLIYLKNVWVGLNRRGGPNREEAYSLDSKTLEGYQITTPFCTTL